MIDESAHAPAVDGEPVAADNEHGADTPIGPVEQLASGKHAGAPVAGESLASEVTAGDQVSSELLKAMPPK